LFGLLIRRTLLQDKARTSRVIFAVALGAAVTTSVLGISIGIGDQVQNELRSYGANIEIVSSRPGGLQAGAVQVGGLRYSAVDNAATIPVDRLPEIERIFWRKQIIGFVPFLAAALDTPKGPVRVVGTWFHKDLELSTGDNLTTGVRDVKSWWKVDGAWPRDTDTDTCLIGFSLSLRWGLHAGDSMLFQVHGQSHSLHVVGILRTGDPDEEQQVIVPIRIIQEWTGHINLAQRVEVSARIKPDDALAHKDPTKLSDADRERLVCSPYMNQVTSQIGSALGDVTVRPVYRIAESEGKLLDRIQLLMAFVLVAALLAAMLGAGSATAAAAMQRRAELGLVKALGAPISSLLLQLITESMILGLLGGVAGTAAGIGLQLWIGREVFGSAGAVPWIVAPVGIFLGIAIAVLSGLFPLWSALQVDPVRVLSEES